MNSYTSILLLRTTGLFVLLYGCIVFLNTLNFSKRDLGWCLLLIFFSSGLGWLWGSFSVDLIQSESSVFFSIFGSVLNPFATGLMLLIFSIFLKCESRYDKVRLFICIALLGLSHTYDLTIILFATALFSLYKYFVEKDFNLLTVWLRLFIYSLPVIFYQAVVLIHNAPLGVWTYFQTSVPGPKFVHFCLTYGLYLTIIILWISYRKREFKNNVFLVTWIIAGMLLLFNPFSVRFQQKFSLGLFIPIVILTYYGLKQWHIISINYIGKFFNRVCIIALGIIFISTNIIIIQNNYSYASSNQELWFLRKKEVLAIDQINQLNPDCSGVIMASYSISNRIPGLTGCSVYGGHYDQTINFNAKQLIVKKMLSSQGKISDPLKHFVAQENISYIVVDEEVRSWGGLDTTNRYYLKLVYDNSDIQIYQVETSLLN